MTIDESRQAASDADAEAEIPAKLDVATELR